MCSSADAFFSYVLLELISLLFHLIIFYSQIFFAFRLYLFDRTAMGQPAVMHSWVLQGDKTEVIVSEILDARLMSNWTYLGSIKESE